MLPRTFPAASDAHATASRLQAEEPVNCGAGAYPVPVSRATHDSVDNIVKKQRDSPSSAPVAVRPRDSVDILERVLTKGAIVETVSDDSKRDVDTGDSDSLRVSISGIDVLNVQTDVSWRSLE